MSLPGKSPVNDWLIVPGVRLGPITPTTTHADLLRLFGRNDVEDGDVTVSDGGPEPGTIIYKNTPADTLSIIWDDGRAGKLIGAIFIGISQLSDPVRSSSAVSRWHTSDGIRFGTTLKTIEKLNGRPFTLLGFGWDHEGNVMSWNGGAMERSLHRSCVTLGLQVNPGAGKAAPNELSGDKEFSSALPGMQRLNPEITGMSVGFAGCAGRSR